MKKITYNYLLIISLVLLATSSCVSSKKMIYFQEVEGITLNDSIQNFEPTLQVGDLLNVTVSAIDTEAAVPFNLYQGARSYLVNVDGDVNFPVLGTVKVIGFTNKQLTDDLTKRLTSYITNPIVIVRLVNFKVSVLGEVKKPGIYAASNERISILEAIGKAGDLTIQGQRSTVTLIREQHGKRTFINIDLTNKQLFNSPYFYLAQNDVVYVTPNKAKINTAAGFNIGTILGIVSTLISITVLLTR